MERLSDTRRVCSQYTSSEESLKTFCTVHFTIQADLKTSQLIAYFITHITILEYSVQTKKIIIKPSGYLHDRLSLLKIPRVPRGLILSCHPVHQSLNLWAFFLSNNWCTDGRNCRRVRAPWAEERKALSTAGPEISTIKGHYEQRQENNREIVAMQMILQRPTQQVNRQK